HRGAHVHGGDIGSVVDEPPRERTGPAADLEHATSRDVAEERDRGRALVARVPGVLLVVGRVLGRHRIVLPGAPLARSHPPSMPPRRPRGAGDPAPWRAAAVVVWHITRDECRLPGVTRRPGRAARARSVATESRTWTWRS